MSTTLKVLFAGESWTIQTTHIKGLDFFSQWGYGTGEKWVRQALEEAGIQVRHLPSHEAIETFPNTVSALSEYQCLILSDIGTNTLLLHPETTTKSKRTPNRLEVIEQYVQQGGALLMIGGYMSFQGIEAKARYANTPVEQALPVSLLTQDDRVEVPQGFSPEAVNSGHPIMNGLPTDPWPYLLFYNRVIAKPNADVLLQHNGEPILAVWNYGEGRAAAFTPDAAPHGAPPEFLEWEHFPRFWQQLVFWLTRTNPG
ncbi:MAG TPA: glutamine amidotransferase [Chthoniobacterales bacterium]